MRPHRLTKVGPVSKRNESKTKVLESLNGRIQFRAVILTMLLKLNQRNSFIGFRLLGCVVLPLALRAEGVAVDKSSFTLFNPTPDQLMREMSTDRPDKTESPYTVDAGHFQIESDLVSYSYNHDSATRVDDWAIAPMNLKVGLCNRVDLQTVVETYRHIRTRDNLTGTPIRQNGFGDITTRLKINLWGNDEGSTALAVMPFLKFPTNQDQLANDRVEGGVIIPFAVGLPAGFSLGLMTEFDFNRNDDGAGNHVEFINSATLSHHLIGKLRGYMELFTAVSSERDADWVGTLDLGLTYGLTPNIQLDVGVNFGLTDSADDLNPFVGLSYRF